MGGCYGSKGFHQQTRPHDTRSSENSVLSPAQSCPIRPASDSDDRLNFDAGDDDTDCVESYGNSSFPPRQHTPNPMSTLRAKRVFFIALLAALAGIGRADDAVFLEGVNATPLFNAPAPDPISVVPPEPLSGFAFTKGGFTIAPYGAFWADMIYATQRTNPGAFTLFVFSEDDQGESALTIDARRTRLGADISGPDFGGGSTGGRVEIDFHGDFVTENRGPSCSATPTGNGKTIERDCSSVRNGTSPRRCIRAH